MATFATGARSAKEPAGPVHGSPTNAELMRGRTDLLALAETLDALAIIAATDIHGTIVYANDAFCRASGYSRSELIGQNHRLLKSGHHPPEFYKKMWRTIAAGKIWRGEIKNRTKQGSCYWVEAAIGPVRDAHGKPSGYVAVCFDIDQRKLADEKLRLQHIQLEMALNNMARGLSMFDKHSRLIACNRLYRQFYSLPESLTKPGTPFTDIIDYYLTREAGPQDAAAAAAQQDWIKHHMEQIRRGETFSRVQHLKSGRTLLVTSRSLPGGGWVDLQEDITEKVRLEEQIRAQNIQLDTALNNMARGLSMFDKDAKLIVCNRLYREIYGLPDHLTQPGTSFADIIDYYMTKEGGEHDAATLESRRMWIEEHIARVSQGQTFSHIQRLKNGRTLLITYQPLTGGGWVDLQEDITEKERAEARIAHMAYHDGLTDMPNRAFLGLQLQQALARVRRGEKLAFHLIDLDYFKAVNDTFGHALGDELLKEVAQRLRAATREIDTVARMGGDEFAAVQVGIDSEADVEPLARRLIQAISEPYEIGGHLMMVGACVGIALAPADGDTPDELMKKADTALYKAKNSGRGTFCLFEEPVKTE